MRLYLLRRFTIYFPSPIDFEVMVYFNVHACGWIEQKNKEIFIDLSIVSLVAGWGCHAASGNRYVELHLPFGISYYFAFAIFKLLFIALN